MKLSKRVMGLVVLMGLLVGSLAVGAIFAGRPTAASAAPAAQTADPCAEDDDSQEAAETADNDGVQEEVQCGSQDANEADEANEANEGNEANETDSGEQDGVVPADWSGLSLDEAKAIAENANPGATAVDAEFEQEGGAATYDVDLDNGVELSIDAVSGEIITSETDTD